MSPKTKYLYYQQCGAQAMQLWLETHILTVPRIQYNLTPNKLSKINFNLQTI